MESGGSSRIAEAIIFAYENREKLEMWGKIGRKIVMEKHTWEKEAQNLEKYLQSIK